MAIGVFFWVIMILSLLFGLYANRPVGPAPDGRWAWAPFGVSLLVFVLLFLLGWRVFGFPIHD
jgi:hypothetical protein